MKAILILFSFILLTSCAHQTARNKTLSNLGEKGRVLASEDSHQGKSGCNTGDRESCDKFVESELEKGNWDKLRKDLKVSCDEFGSSMLSCFALGTVEVYKFMSYQCNNHDKNKCYGLGISFYNRGFYNLAKKYFKKGCGDGSGVGCFGLWKLEYKDGDYVGLREYLKKGCGGEFIPECFELGELERSEGRVIDATKAYKKACDGSHEKACNSLKALIKSGAKVPLVL